MIRNNSTSPIQLLIYSTEYAKTTFNICVIFEYQTISIVWIESDLFSSIRKSIRVKVSIQNWMSCFIQDSEIDSVLLILLFLCIQSIHLSNVEAKLRNRKKIKKRYKFYGIKLSKIQIFTYLTFKNGVLYIFIGNLIIYSL